MLAHPPRAGISRRLALACIAPLVACAVALTGACQEFKAAMSGAAEPVWVGGEVAAATERILWQICALTLRHEGFPPGAGFDPVDNTAVSGWKMSLAPFKGKGWREQAQIRFLKSQPGYYKVEVRVWRQANQDMAKPLDPAYADWQDVKDDVDRAQILLQGIKSWLSADNAPAVPPIQNGGG